MVPELMFFFVNDDGSTIDVTVAGAIEPAARDEVVAAGDVATGAVVGAAGGLGCGSAAIKVNAANAAARLVNVRISYLPRGVLRTFARPGQL